MQQTLLRRIRPPGDGSAFFLYEGFGLPVEAVHHFFEIAGVIVRPDHVARFIVNANHSIM